jgi:hypothetical protein
MITIPKAPGGTPLVTVEEVDAWREDLRLLKIQQEETNSKIRDLEARLAAADFFVRERAANRIATPVLSNGKIAPEPKTPQPPTMQEAVLRIIRKNPSGLEPKQISNVIRIDPDMPPKIKNSHPNYIYTTLMRLAQRGMIKKDGATYKPVETAGG